MALKYALPYFECIFSIYETPANDNKSSVNKLINLIKNNHAWFRLFPRMDSDKNSNEHYLFFLFSNDLKCAFCLFYWLLHNFKLYFVGNYVEKGPVRCALTVHWESEKMLRLDNVIGVLFVGGSTRVLFSLIAFADSSNYRGKSDYQSRVSTCIVVMHFECRGM